MTHIDLLIVLSPTKNRHLLHKRRNLKREGKNLSGEQPGQPGKIKHSVNGTQLTTDYSAAIWATK